MTDATPGQRFLPASFSKARLWLGLGAVLLGLGLALLPLGWHVEHARQSHASAHAHGRVTSVKAFHGRRTPDFKQVVVSWADQRGDHRVERFTVDYDDDYAVGDKVQILYDPRPGQLGAYLDRPRERFGLSGFSAVLIWVGLGLGTAGAMRLARVRS